MIGPSIDEIVGTAFLLVFVLALTDERNQPSKANLAPLLVGLAVAAIGMSFGANAGYAINPARDFGPRFFAWLAGWDTVALPGVHGYTWVPIIGPLIGGVIGAVVYDFFIRDVLRGRGAPPAPDVAARGETVEEEPTGSRPRGPGGRAGRRRGHPGERPDRPRSVAAGSCETVRCLAARYGSPDASTRPTTIRTDPGFGPGCAGFSAGAQSRPLRPGSRRRGISCCWPSAATPIRGDRRSVTSPGTCSCATTARSN
jgi:hypothetical protein